MASPSRKSKEAVIPHASSLALLLLLRLLTHKVRITIPRINLPLARLQVLLDGAETAQSIGVIGFNAPKQLIGRSILGNHLVGLVNAFLVGDLGIVFVDLLFGAADPDALVGFGFGRGGGVAGGFGLDGHWVGGHCIRDGDGGGGHGVGEGRVSHCWHVCWRGGWRRRGLLNGRWL